MTANPYHGIGTLHLNDGRSYCSVRCRMRPDESKQGGSAVTGMMTLISESVAFLNELGNITPQKVAWLEMSDGQWVRLGSVDYERFTKPPFSTDVTCSDGRIADPPSWAEKGGDDD